MSESLQWVQVSVAFAVGLLAGIGGFAGIHRFLVRPRVYGRHRFWEVVRTDDPERRAQVEQILRGQDLATHVVEVEWWNAGRRAAQGVVIEVHVPGDIFDFSVSPPADDPGAAHETTFPQSLTAKRTHDRLRVVQARLMPRKRCLMTIGFIPATEATSHTTIHMYQGDREIVPKPPEPPSAWVARGAMYMAVGVLSAWAVAASLPFHFQQAASMYLASAVIATVVSVIAYVRAAGTSASGNS